MIGDLALNMAVMFALVATRMGAFVAVSPFPPPSVPGLVRVGLALALSLAATPLVLGGPVPAIGPPLVVAGLGELAAGAAIGFVFRVGLSAADILGSTVSHSTGLTFASSYDPALASNSDGLTRVFTTIAMSIAIAIGAHRAVIGALVLSTRAVPIGGMLDVAVYGPGIVAWLVRSVECGVGLALPAMTVAVVVQVALGLVARAAPALQIFSVGLSITLAAGLVVALAGMRDVVSALGVHLGGVTSVLERLLAHRS